MEQKPSQEITFRPSSPVQKQEVEAPGAETPRLIFSARRKSRKSKMRNRNKGRAPTFTLNAQEAEIDDIELML